MDPDSQQFFFGDAGTNTGKPKRSGGVHAPYQTTLLRALVGLLWASRSGALEDLESGSVTVDDHVETDPRAMVDLRKQEIAVLGHVLNTGKQRPIMLIAHKARGVAGSREVDIPHLLDSIPGHFTWYAPCGVLPRSASGMVLLTTSAEHADPIATPLAHLSSDLWVKVHRRPTELELAMVTDRLNDPLYQPIPGGQVSIGRQGREHVWLKAEHVHCSLRQLGATFRPAGLEVLAWERRRLGPFLDSAVPSGGWRRVPEDHVAELEAVMQAGIDDATPFGDVWEAIAAAARKHE